MKIQFVLKKEIKKLFNLKKFKNIFVSRKQLKLVSLIFLFIPIFSQKQIFSDIDTSEFQIENNNYINWKKNYPVEKNNIKWKKINIGEKNKKDIIWQKIENNEDNILPIKESIKYQELSKNNKGISSFNRSIVFNDSLVGPDVSWLVPPGFKWNSNYKFDASIRGHNRRKKGENFFGWNNGDAVGQLYFQFLDNKKTSFGINFGIRSVYKGSAAGGKTSIGEGQSLGFRIDRRISATEGFSLGAEQLLHFDGLTDTGRDIYLSVSKAMWSNNKKGFFPLHIFTFGVATGKMSEGNIKFLCSNLLGGSGTELLHQRRLCWSPVFSIARVHNKNFSTFFEYNSKFFLLGKSIIPFNKIPLRSTLAVQLSDHIDNYKIKNFNELKWVFRLSLGF